MLRNAFFAVSLLILCVQSAGAAQGVNLRWTHCYSDLGTINKNFACDSNVGTAGVLVGSFEVGVDFPQCAGQEVVLDFQTLSSTLPAWWQFKDPGACRQNALSVNTVMSADAIICEDWAQGQATAVAGAYTVGFRGANTARLVIAVAVPLAARADLVTGHEYFSFNVLIDRAQTIGSGACSGCSTPACMLLKQIKVIGAQPQDDRTLTGPTNGTDSDMTAWQGGLGLVCFTVPTARSTWARLKSLYR